MNVELKNIKFFEEMSEETNCYHASIHIDGKKVGFAQNRGHGGGTDLNFQDKNIADAFYTYANSLPPIKYISMNEVAELKMDGDLFIDHLFEDYIKNKAEQKLYKKNLKKGFPITMIIDDTTVYGLKSESQIDSLKLKHTTNGIIPTIKIIKS